MANIKEKSFINHYPFIFHSVTQRVVVDMKLDIKENELYYETPIINFNSNLFKSTINYHFKKHLGKYLKNIKKHSDEYIEKKYDIYSLAFNYGIVATYDIYIFKGKMKNLNKFLVIEMMIIYQLILFMVFQLPLLFHLLKFLLKLMYI